MSIAQLEHVTRYSNSLSTAIKCNKLKPIIHTTTVRPAHDFGEAINLAGYLHKPNDVIYANGIDAMKEAALEAKKAVYGYVKMKFLDVVQVQASQRCSFKHPQGNGTCNSPVENGKCTAKGHTCNQPAAMLELVTEYSDVSDVNQIFDSTIGSEDIFPSLSAWEVGDIVTFSVCF